MLIQVLRTSPDQPISYSELEQIQQEHAQKLRSMQTNESLLLVAEIKPTLTSGLRNTQSQDFMTSLEDLQGIEYHKTRRGGHHTYHGPGQWIVFYVDRVSHLSSNLSVHELTCKLLRAGHQVCLNFTQEAIIRTEPPVGIWTSHGSKLVSLGIAIDRRIVQHGLCFNVYQTSDSFRGIKPCGLNASVAFLSEFPSLRTLPPHEAMNRVLIEIKRVFGILSTENPSQTLPTST
jgi:lipoyl(octanoyl) transferase